MIPVQSAADVAPLDPRVVKDVLDDVAAEVNHQDILARAGRFGGTHILPSGPDEARLPVLLEEVGEVAHELNEAYSKGRNATDLYQELIQVAACATAWATAIREGRSE